MKLIDIIKTIGGLDSTKDYNLSVEEIVEQQKTIEPTPVENNNAITVQDNSSIVEMITLQEQITKLTAENEQLKSVNKQIVLNTAVEPEPVVEERIMSLCAPQLLNKGEYI